MMGILNNHSRAWDSEPSSYHHHYPPMTGEIQPLNYHRVSDFVSSSSPQQVEETRAAADEETMNAPPFIDFLGVGAL